MAGHSKWANIQHRKGRQDEKRGKAWTRVIREIMVAARTGGGAAPLTVRGRLVVEPTLPRFLAPDDSARFTVALQSVDLPPGAVTMQVSTEGPLRVTGDLPFRPTLQPGTRVRVAPTLQATVSELDRVTRTGAHTTFFQLGDDPGLSRFLNAMARRADGRVVAVDPEELGSAVLDEYLSSKGGE